MPHKYRSSLCLNKGCQERPLRHHVTSGPHHSSGKPPLNQNKQHFPVEDLLSGVIPAGFLLVSYLST